MSIEEAARELRRGGFEHGVMSEQSWDGFLTRGIGYS